MGKIETRAETRRRLALLQPFLFEGSMARPLDEVGRERVLSHRWLARSCAWKFAARYARDMQFEELEGEALFALTYAAGLFRDDLQVPFAAYAAIVIRHRLIQATNRWRGGRYSGSRPRLMGGVEWDAIDRPKPEPGEQVGDEELCARVRHLMPSEWYEALQMYHGEGHTLWEIGRHFGISAQRVRRVLTMAAKRVRRFLPESNSF